MFVRKKSQNTDDNTKWIEWIDAIAEDLVHARKYLLAEMDQIEHIEHKERYSQYAMAVGRCIDLLRKSSSDLSELLPFGTKHDRKNFETQITQFLKEIEQLRKDAYRLYPQRYERDVWPLVQSLYDLIIRASIV